MKEILISTSFASFNDPINNNIQRKFLSSLENQTYKNFKLVVILFDQDEIIKILKEYDIEYIFVYSYISDQAKSIGMSVDPYKWITESISKISNEDIFIFTFADFFFPNTMLEKIVQNFEENLIAISYPILKKKIKDIENKKIFDITKKKYVKNCFKLDPNKYVSEFFILDTNLFKNNLSKNVFAKNSFVQLSGLNYIQVFSHLSKNKKNLFYEFQIINFYNDYQNQNTKKMHENTTKYEKQIEKSGSDLSKNLYASFGEKNKLKKKFFYGPFRKINNINEFKIKGNFFQILHYKYFIKLSYIINFFIKGAKKLENILNFEK